MGQGGKAGRITQLKTTPGFEHPDGMRAYGKNGLLVVEGANAGRFDMIELSGDNAEVRIVKSGAVKLIVVESVSGNRVVA